MLKLLIQGVLTTIVTRYDLHVLEGLDKVECSKLSHAYGPATDVPGQLRALAAGDEQQWKRAIWEMHGNIWHQHTVYEATSFAVPFLVELVKNKVPAQESILRLIALIAARTSYLEVHRMLLQDWEPEQEQQLQRELEWVGAANRAVAAHAEFFLT